MPHVNTKSVKRRAVRFSSLDDMLAEADRLAAAERAGTLRTLGNWTLGQALHHVAVWMNFAFEGFPPGARPPGIIRFLLRFMRKKLLNDALPAGVRIPKVEGGTYGTEPVPTDQALIELRAAVKRLRSEPAKHESPAFGPMTTEEREKLNLRHAELHLGFFEG